MRMFKSSLGTSLLVTIHAEPFLHTCLRVSDVAPLLGPRHVLEV